MYSIAAQVCTAVLLVVGLFFRELVTVFEHLECLEFLSLALGLLGFVTPELEGLGSSETTGVGSSTERGENLFLSRIGAG